ncbi:MAG: cation diffusion facilitator family transporter [Lachnospiraceae bacterium]|nr:cation diffusion facilitator family transporter [Lachnospiraceae bacterium]
MNQTTVDTARDKVIIRTSIIGILANVFLAAFKAVVGIFSHSIAIVLDAINNLSDAASSLITIIGTKLAAREPDRKHPFGYGRIEYLSAMVISVIVLYAGVTSLVESVKKILHPDIPDYSTATLIIVAVGVVVKIVLGRYVKSVGVKVNSASLVNSGEDATLDSVISASTLIAAFIFLWKGISLEAWLGAVISCIIIKAGLEMLSETLSKLLGERASAELILAIKDTVRSLPEVQGVYDLVLHNYGPDTFTGSLHIAVADTFGAQEIDRLIREVSTLVYEKHGIALTAVSIYSVNTSHDKAASMQEEISRRVLAIDHVLQMHGFYVDEKRKRIRFDVVISFDAKSRQAVCDQVVKEVSDCYPDYVPVVVIDTDFSETLKSEA